MDDSKKISALNFIKEANEFQLLYFLEIAGVIESDEILISEDTNIQYLIEKSIIDYLAQGAELGLGGLSKAIDRVIQGIEVGASAVGKGAEKGADLAVQVFELNPPAAAAAAAAIIAASIIIYKKQRGASGACRKYKGSERESCIKKYKNEAIKAQIRALEGSKKLCSKSKNPKVCTSKVEVKIQKLKAKLK